MNTNNIKQLALEELKKRSDILTVVTIALGVLSLISIGLAIYMYINLPGKGMINLFVPFALSPIFIMNIFKLKKINSEIKSRQ